MREFRRWTWLESSLVKSEIATFEIFAIQVEVEKYEGDNNV